MAYGEEGRDLDEVKQNQRRGPPIKQEPEIDRFDEGTYDIVGNTYSITLQNCLSQAPNTNAGQILCLEESTVFYSLDFRQAS